jgi:hypothetical protein
MLPLPLTRLNPAGNADGAILLFCRPTPSQASVDAFFHDIAGPEDENASWRDRNFLSRLWIATHTFALLADVEGAEG